MSKENPLNQDPITNESGAHPIGTSVGAGSGAIAGAAIGTVTGGPLGTLVGGMIGAIAGGMAGKEVAEAANPTVGGDHEDHLVGEGVGASAGVLLGATLGSAAGPIGTVAGAGVGAILGGVTGEKVDEMVNPDSQVSTQTTHLQHNPLKDISSSDLDNMHKTELHRLPESAMTENNHNSQYDITNNMHPVGSQSSSTVTNQGGTILGNSQSTQVSNKDVTSDENINYNKTI